MKKLLLISALFFATKSNAALCDHSLNFSGGICYVTCGANPVLSPTTAVTVEAWIFAADTLSNQKIAGNIDPFSNSGYEIGMDAGQLYCEVKDINGLLHDFKAGLIHGNEWTHIAFTYNVGGQFLGFINGEQIYSEAAGTAAIGNAISNDFIIGAAPWDQTYFNYNGRIDEVRVYNSARTIGQIRGDMRIDVSTLAQADLIGYWRFLEGSGTTTADLSPNGSTAALSGSNLPTWADGDGPYNIGVADGLLLTCCSPVNFTNARVSITATALSAAEAFVVSKLECDPGGLLPTGSNSYNFGYWNVDRYAQAIVYNGVMTFFVDSDLIDLADVPTDFVLYNRSSNSTGAWTQVGTATAVNAATKAITFTTGSTSGQFVIGSNGNTILSANQLSKKAFSFYPNPANQFLQLQFADGGNHLIQVKDLQGRVVLSQNVASESSTFDISQLHAGLYFISTGNSTQQFIITR